MLWIFLAFIPPSFSLFNYFGGTQSVAVTGWLTCNRSPASGVKVKLYDVNTCWFGIYEKIKCITVYLDHFLGEQLSNSTGGFYVQGSENSVTTIAPKLNIYHKCNYNGVSYVFTKHSFVSALLQKAFNQHSTNVHYY